jgi:nitrous oxidase accessory protein NosD
VDHSDGLTIYHNRFLRNSIQAEESNSTGVAWNAPYPDGGNFWSDYRGLDDSWGPLQDIPGSDGIMDTPYLTNGSGIDMYPWKEQTMSFSLQDNGTSSSEQEMLNAVAGNSYASKWRQVR